MYGHHKYLSLIFMRMLKIIRYRYFTVIIFNEKNMLVK